MRGTIPRQELVELVRHLVRCEGSEQEMNAWLATIQQNIADPHVTDYIFWPDRPMTPEDIVERALAYEPVRIPPAQSGAGQGQPQIAAEQDPDHPE